MGPLNNSNQPIPTLQVFADNINTDRSVNSQLINIQIYNVMSGLIASENPLTQPSGTFINYPYY